MGFDHQRPAKRHREGAGSGAAAAARGHSSSTAAMIAAISSGSGTACELAARLANIAVLALGSSSRGAQQLEAGDDLGAGVRGRSSSTKPRSALQVGEALGVLLDQLGLARHRVGRDLRLRQ
jgi:hypothetical protein